MPVDSIFTSIPTSPQLYEDFMFQFKDDGVIVNAEPWTGAFVDITKVQGLDSAPVRATEREREGMDGGFVDAEFTSMRAIILTGSVYGSEDSVELFLDQLKANYAPSSQVYPFYFSMGGVGIRVCFCKSYGVQYDITQYRRHGQVDVQFILRAEDSTIYGGIVTGSIELNASTVRGRGYNRSYNYGYGGSGQSSSSFTVVNSGNMVADADVIINGPITDPSVYHDQSGKTLKYSIVLNANDILTTNLRNRTVRLNGGANRRNTLKGADPWFLLSPGRNTFRFFGTQQIAGVKPSLQVATRPAFR